MPASKAIYLNANILWQIIYYRGLEFKTIFKANMNLIFEKEFPIFTFARSVSYSTAYDNATKKI
jgi:hypothetical protein